MPVGLWGDNIEPFDVKTSLQAALALLRSVQTLSGSDKDELERLIENALSALHVRE